MPRGQRQAVPAAVFQNFRVRQDSAADKNVFPRRFFRAERGIGDYSRFADAVIQRKVIAVKPVISLPGHENGKIKNIFDDGIPPGVQAAADKRTGGEDEGFRVEALGAAIGG